MITKHRKIDINNLNTLMAAANVIYPMYTTILGVVHIEAKSPIIYPEIYPNFDFETEGSYTIYPNTYLEKQQGFPFFAVISIKSQYSIN